MMDEKIVIDRLILEDKYLFYRCYSEAPGAISFEISKEGTLHIGEGKTYEFNNLENMLEVFKSLVRGTDAFIQSLKKQDKTLRTRNRNEGFIPR